MYKKFIITFVLFLGIFGTTAFAGTLQGGPVPSSVVSAVGDRWLAFTYSADEYVYICPVPSNVTVTYSALSNGGTLVKFSSPVTVHYNSYDDFQYVWKTGQYSEITTNTTWGLYYSGLSKPTGVGTLSYLKNEQYSSLVFHQPSLEEVKNKGLGNLMTGFGANLVVLLKVGVIILAILLGVSLIPRLVRLFL